MGGSETQKPEKLVDYRGTSIVRQQKHHQPRHRDTMVLVSNQGMAVSLLLVKDVQALLNSVFDDVGQVLMAQSYASVSTSSFRTELHFLEPYFGHSDAIKKRGFFENSVGFVVH